MAAGFLGHGAVHSLGSYRLGRKQGKPWNRIAWYKFTSKLYNRLHSLRQYKHLQYTPVRYFLQVHKTGATESGAALVFHSQVQEQRERDSLRSRKGRELYFKCLPCQAPWSLKPDSPLGFHRPRCLIWKETLCWHNGATHCRPLCVSSVMDFSIRFSPKGIY